MSPKPKTPTSYNRNNTAVNSIQTNSSGSDSPQNITEQESVINSTSVGVEECYDQESETSVKHLEEREQVQEVFVDENKDNRLAPVIEKVNGVAVTDTQYFNNTANGGHNLVHNCYFCRIVFVIPRRNFVGRMLIWYRASTFASIQSR